MLDILIEVNCCYIVNFFVNVFKRSLCLRNFIIELLNVFYVIFIKCQFRDVVEIKWKYDGFWVLGMVQFQVMIEFMKRKLVEIYFDVVFIYVIIFIVIKV